MHARVRDIARRRYCGTAAASAQGHARLQSFLQRLVDPAADCSWQGYPRLKRFMSYQVTRIDDMNGGPASLVHDDMNGGQHR